MKYLLFILLPFSICAQNSSMNTNKTKLSVIGLDKMNVVYRGLPNPISISVSKNVFFSVVAKGIKKLGSGKYILKPGIGDTVDIFVHFKNKKGKKIIEKHTLRVKNTPQPIGLLNGENCENCLVFLKRDDISKSIISTKMDSFLFFDSESDFFKVNSFEVKFDENKILKVFGNCFSEEVILEVNSLDKGSVFEIINIHYGPDCLECNKRAVYPIKVILED